MSAQSPSVLFAYSPLIDKQHRIAGLSLALNAERGANDQHAGQALKAAAESWPETGKPVYVRVPKALAGAGLTQWTPPKGTVLELEVESLADAAWTGGWNGHKPAFAASVGATPPAGRMLTGFSSLVVDGAALGGTSQNDALKAACRSAPWIARRVDEPRTFSMAILRGAKFAAGFSFLAPGETLPKDALASAANVVQLLELVNRDADIDEIEAILKRDVVLAFKLVSIVNSAAYGLPVEIRSFQHAITIVGLKKLKRWLALLLATSAQGSPPALASASLLRATFLEAIGRELGYTDALDDLFIIGAFSHLDRILRTSFETLFEKVAVSQDVADAVMHRTGQYGPLLRLVEMLEDRGTPGALELAESLALEPAVVNQCLLTACGAALKTTVE